jgi:hypothetical protein
MGQACGDIGKEIETIVPGTVRGLPAGRSPLGIGEWETNFVTKLIAGRERQNEEN